MGFRPVKWFWGHACMYAWLGFSLALESSSVASAMANLPDSKGGEGEKV